MVMIMMMIVIIILIKDKTVPVHAMKAFKGVEVQLHPFLTSTLDGGEWSASCLGCVMPLGKDLPVPIELQTGWTPELVWLLWKGASLPLLRKRLKFQNNPACTIVILATELAKLYFKFCASRRVEMWEM